MAVNLGTRGIEDACNLLEYTNHPRRHGHVRPAHRATACRTRTTSSCGAWATRWTAPGRSGTRAPRSTGGWRPRPPRRCVPSTPASSWSPAAARCRRMPTFGAWEADRARARLRHRRLHLPARLLHQRPRRIGPASSPPATRWTPSSTASSRPATTSAPMKRSRRKLQLTFDEWNVWHVGQNAGDDHRVGPGAAADRGRVHRRGRGRRRQPADQPAAARRPGRHRLPGPAGQRDRPDPDRAGSRGLAADHLLPLRADRPSCHGSGAAHAAAGRRHPHQEPRRRSCRRCRR